MFDLFPLTVGLHIVDFTALCLALLVCVAGLVCRFLGFQFTVFFGF